MQVLMQVDIGLILSPDCEYINLMYLLIKVVLC